MKPLARLGSARRGPGTGVRILPPKLQGSGVNHSQSWAAPLRYVSASFLRGGGVSDRASRPFVREA